jgi:flagellar biosynthesis/type III secretory pathway protein FliH
MTHWVLCRAGGLELGIEGDPVVAADELPVVADAMTVMRRLASMREALARSGQAYRETALREALLEARAIAESEAREAIARAAAAFDEALRQERALLQDREVELALAIVAKIASSLGDAPTLAALARTAIAELDVGRPARVRVHPSLEPAIRAALSDAAGGLAQPSIEVVGDERLERLECEIDQGDAIVDAGLGTQLQAIREALGSAAGASF